MNRRGHLSHKVPNVKLRPAPRRSTRRNPSPGDAEIVQRAWEDAESHDDGIVTGTDRPWKGIFVTFTGIEDKATLSKLVVELGGVVESALTVSVTHVVAIGYGSPKYAYALENRIAVLSPSWIVDAHARWLRGDDLDIPASVEAHRLQAFVGLKIAISGIDQLERRKQIIRYINSNGGVYSKDLDRSCTHLISAWPTTDPKAKTSDKIKWALKEIGDRDVARRRGRKLDGEDIRIVYEEWIWDCVAYGGRFSEAAYDARKPRPIGKVTVEAVLDGSALEALRPKEVVPEEEEEPVVVKKRKREEFESLVGELLSTTKVDVREAVDKVDTSMVMEVDEDVKPRIDSPAPEPPRPKHLERKQSVLHTSRSTSFAAPVAGPSRTEPPAPERPQRPLKPIFTGLRLSHAISDGYQGLEAALVQHGGVLVPETERLSGALVDYVIIRLSSLDRPPIPPDSGTRLVTECWVEGCCFEQRLLSPDANLVFQPLSIALPVPGADKLLVHISGFPTETTVYLRRLLKTIGGALSEKLNRRTSHLVCAAPQGIKYDKAREWGVTVVRDSWLWTIGKEGYIDDPANHAHESSGPPVAYSDITGSSLPPTRLLKSTPTHIDNPSGAGGSGTLDGSGGVAKDSTASVVEKENVAAIIAEVASARASPARSASAPGSSPLTKRTVPALKAATVGGGGRDEVTAALRRLAESDAPQRAKVPRRSRPSTSRPKLDAHLRSTSPATPSEPPVDGPAPPPGLEDESMRVTYADPVSEKERRRLLDAVMRGGTSPVKRAKV